MRLELSLAGHEVEFIAVNKQLAESTQSKLVAQCAFPLVQDVEEIDVWGLHNGGKDDFFVFDKEASLAVYLPHGGEVSTNLSTEAGYTNVKTALLGVLEGP